MSKDPYKIVDTKASWSSKLGSGVVALGSVATAIVITVPGLPGYQLLSEANAVVNDSNPIDAQTATGEGSSVELGPSATAVSNPANSGSIALTGNSNSSQTQTVLSGPKSSKGQPSSQLSLPGVTSGNTSSPTPSAASGSGANASAGGSTSTGNTTSPTPTSSGGNTSNANNNTGGNTSSGNTSSPTPSGEDSYGSSGEDD